MTKRFFTVRRAGGPGLTAAVTGALLLAALLAPAPARAANLPGLTVVGLDATGAEIGQVTDYRWLVEHDLTYHVGFDGSGNPISVPGTPGFDPNWPNTLSVSFYRTYMPVVGAGCVNMPAEAACTDNPVSFPTLEPNQYYFVSVLPSEGYTIGGVGFKTDSSGNVPATTVFVHQTPLPTAQISIQVFPDYSPINGAPDEPQEDPAVNGIDMSGFKIVLEDGGGRYGAAAGTMSTDVYGNPLGTTYNPDGTVARWGGDIYTGPDGWAHIYNLAQGKYGVQAVPPAGSDWVQTSTIEGTHIIDAWVKPNEPPFFAEFGPPGPHVFIGFARPQTAGLGGSATLSGQVVNLHMSRPPNYTMYPGACFGHTTPWVGLNDLSTGVGQAVYAAPTDGDCNFSIPNVPDGNYELVIWDSALDLIIATKAISVVGGACSTPSGSCDLGPVPVFQWFHRQEWTVFNDLNGNGFRDCVTETCDGPGEDGPLPDVPLNLRWRDGSIYQTNVTDNVGAYAFDEVFPFFSWLVAEVGFTRLQATGVTVTVDDGGAIDSNNPWSYGGQLNPQNQLNPPCTATDPSCTDTETLDNRTEHGPVLLEAFQGFIGQTTAFEWGKRHYPDLCEDGLTECANDADCAGIGSGTCSLTANGGITGIVFYDTTRAENDPELAAGEVWEPGIPGVKVNLYDATGTTLLNTTFTDSWDAAIPTGCKYGNGGTGPYVFSPDGVHTYPTDCYDGLRNFNQVRPGVFDGGYAFDAICSDPGGMQPDGTCTNLTSPLPAGSYVVEIIPPPGYEVYKPEDKNVDFGDSYQQPNPALLLPKCVGTETEVPQYLTLYPNEHVEVVDWVPGMTAPLCDKKLVRLQVGANAAADFFLFTEVPIAAHGVGFILDDTQNEFDPNAPNFGEKYAPPFMPVSLRDWTGREIGRTYSDQYGLYNFLVPSTATINAPQPSGVSPNMVTACMNDATRPDGSLDPHHNPIYSQFCYTLQYMPGVYTYLDTPVIPVGAFAGPDRFPVDCEYPDGTPRIGSVTVATNGVGGGPYIPRQNNGTPIGNQTITINALDGNLALAGAQVQVPNPNYCNPLGGNCPAGADTVNKTIWRSSGFGGTQGTVSLGGLNLPITRWSDDQITATVGDNTNVGAVGGRQLTVTRSDGVTALTGVTVQFGLRGTGSNLAHVLTVNNPANPVPATNYPTIQRAIDAAAPNDLILVNSGLYNEMVIMWKPVQLQGWGEGSTRINALKQPVEKLTAWRAKVEQLITNGSVDLLPGQEVGFGGIEPVTLFNEEGAGILVLAPATGAGAFDVNNRNRGARIDGFTITGADTGGGVIVNGYGKYLEISNNRVANNSGTFGGGIRVGHPLLVNATQDGYEDAQNDLVKIHNNQVNQNGSLDGPGAGIAMCTGSDSYQVTDNWVCGNFSTADGGGIGHIGVSTRNSGTDPIPLIERNRVLFNETFNQGVSISGGGISIGGAPALTAGGLTPGAGNVQVLRNLIQGNSAGSGDGGGIRLAMVNGEDVAGSSNRNNWYGVDLFDNIIVDNVAGLAGGGVSLQDAVKVRIYQNTIANNDSLATAGQAFVPGSPGESTPQPGAGIVTRAHSPELLATGRNIGAFSDPDLRNTIVWHNRKFRFWVDPASGCIPGDPSCTSTYGVCPDLSVPARLNCPGGNTVVYDNLGVIGAAGSLTCDGGCFSNNGGNPAFVREYVNGDRSDVYQNEITTSIQAPAAFDEGGNFIRPNYGPLTLIAQTTPQLLWDYHILNGPAYNTGVVLSCTLNANAGLCPDVDGLYRAPLLGDTRPLCGGYDIGADERTCTPMMESTEPGSDQPLSTESVE